MNRTMRILRALGVGYMIYDNLRESYYHQWCLQYSRKFGLSLQVMVTHDGLRKWYQDEWIRRVEQPFVRHYGKQFTEENSQVLLELFFEYPESIREIYPGPLLKIIKDDMSVNQLKTAS